MRSFAKIFLIVTLSLVGVGSFTPPSQALVDEGERPVPETKGPEAAVPRTPKTDEALPPKQDAPDADAKSAKEKPLKKRTGPATVEERDRILKDLYERLATAKNADYAKLLETAIQRLWIFSGSDTIDLLMRRVQVAQQQDNSKVAVQLLNAVIGLQPKYAEGWNQRAFIHFSNKDYGAALRDLRRVLSIDPQHFKAIGGLAVILREYGRSAAALKAFRKALEIHPLDAEIKKAVNELEIEVEGQEI